MIDREKFETLIKMPESPELDFKKDMFDLSKDDTEYSKTGKIVKDIISFSNTIRVNTSYIIIGVEVNGDGTKILHGIKQGFDDAIIQDKVKDKITPVPNFKTYIFEYDSKKFGIIEFPVVSYSTFLTSTIKMKGVDAGVTYYRQGSSNQEAKGQKNIEINEWIKSNKVATGKTIQDEITDFRHQISTDNNKLASIIIDIHRFAYNNGFKDLAEYCDGELIGFKVDSKFVKMRFVRQEFAFGSYKNTYPRYFSVDDIKPIMEVKELPLFHDMSINDIQHEIGRYTFSAGQKNYHFTFCTLNDALLKNLPANDGDRIISRIYTITTYREIYKKIKNNLFELLTEVNKTIAANGK
jgi:hypothetical protein